VSGVSLAQNEDLRATVDFDVLVIDQRSWRSAPRMNVLRFASLLSAVRSRPPWFVTLAVRATVGAPTLGTDCNRGRADGAALATALAIPARDPFFADASFAPGPLKARRFEVPPGGSGRRRRPIRDDQCP